MTFWNDRLMSRYERLDPAESEFLSKTWKCWDTKNQENVFVKWRQGDTARAAGMFKMINMFLKLDHINVCRLNDVIVSNKDGWYFVYQYLDYSMGGLINTNEIHVDSKMMKNLLIQMLQGLNYCHSQNVKHTNLSPRTVFYDRATSTVKLADFSYASSGGETTGLCRHPIDGLSPSDMAYMAPELLLSCKTHAVVRYTCSVDVWSVGCIFAGIVGKKPFFGGDSLESVMDDISRKLDMPSYESYSEFCERDVEVIPTGISDLGKDAPDVESDAIDLLSKMLRFRPSERITAAAALDHPYLENAN